jgi:uncharacterized surface protein with fasciclin (FAS1) repeats
VVVNRTIRLWCDSLLEAFEIIGLNFPFHLLFQTTAIFAPSDEAFMALPTGVLDYLLKPANVAMLSQIFGYHVVPGTLLATDLANATVLSSLTEQNLAITSTDTGGLAVNGANIVTADLLATNGAIHIIDRVLIPPTVVLPVDIIKTGIAAGGFTTLVAAVEAAGLTETLKTAEVTLFAPNNAAFDALPTGALDFLIANPMSLKEVLLYHVVPGETMSNALSDGDQLATLLEGSNLTVAITEDMVTINGNANVVDVDIIALNGVAHVIDTVLIPQYILDTLPLPGIFKVATETGQFTTLLAAIQSSGLGDALNTPGPFSKYFRL